MCTFFTDEVTSDLINAARKIRHTLGGAFSPTTDITEILVGGLEKVSTVWFEKYYLHCKT